VVILSSNVGWAQSAASTTDSSQDRFNQWHESLRNAADRALAAALADRPWMKNPETPTLLVDRTPNHTTDLVMRLHAGIQRVERLRPTIDPILQREGVPTELSAVVLIESGGQRTALSPKGARGIWQFMPATARRYGLTVSTDQDERVDIVKSTQAAARYLRDLHQQFGDWQLAVAAYNTGEQAVAQAVSHVGKRNFLGIQHALPRETRDYVPAVLNAVAVLGGTPEQLGRTIIQLTPNSRHLVYALTEESN
jgi:membrane-bound lytic murein transglycosylase MltF